MYSTFSVVNFQFLFKGWHITKGRNQPLVYEVAVSQMTTFVPFVVITIQFFLHSWLIIGFVTRVTRRVPHLEQELRTFPKHLSSIPVFSGVRVTRSLVLCVMFYRSLFVPLFFFCHCVVFPSPIYDFNLISPLISSNVSKCNHIS